MVKQILLLGGKRAEKIEKSIEPISQGMEFSTAQTTIHSPTDATPVGRCSSSWDIPCPSHGGRGRGEKACFLNMSVVMPRYGRHGGSSGLLHILPFG